MPGRVDQELQDILQTLARAEIADQKNLRLDPRIEKRGGALQAVAWNDEFRTVYDDTRYGRTDIPPHLRKPAEASDFLGAINQLAVRAAYNFKIRKYVPDRLSLSKERIEVLMAELEGLRVEDLVRRGLKDKKKLIGDKRIITPIRILDEPEECYSPDDVTLQNRRGRWSIDSFGEATYAPRTPKYLGRKFVHIETARDRYPFAITKETGLILMTPHVKFRLPKWSHFTGQFCASFSTLDLIRFGLDISVAPQSRRYNDTLAHDRPEIVYSLRDRLGELSQPSRYYHSA